MPISQTSFDNIKVGYISETDGYVQNVSLADANAYAELNPETEFIFIDGDEKVRFLTINEVNALTPKNLLRSDPCLTGDQPCGPPKLKFFGGGGVGASANPVIDVNGNLIAVDLVSGVLDTLHHHRFKFLIPVKMVVVLFFKLSLKMVLLLKLLLRIVVKVIFHHHKQFHNILLS